MKATEVVQKVTKPAAKFGAATAGLIGGSFVTSKIPELSFLNNIPVVGPHLARVAPGVAVMALGLIASKKVNNELLKQAAFGVSLAGFANALKRVASGIPALAPVADAIPSGLGIVRDPTNYGQYPASYYTDSNKAYKLDGLGNNAYSLEGAGQAYRLNGLGERSQAYLLLSGR